MVNALFDTCILTDYLQGIRAAQSELRRYDHVAISAITWIEVMVGAPSEVRDQTRSFLDGFGLIPLDQEVVERTVKLRQTYRVKLPDAIIWASADTRGWLLITRDHAFPKDHPGIRVPYRV
ncbi:MAG: type II toxin-antitoxin system VapC family toxin [Acetobacteraceae bacterium]|nr:type II toxin-antitoxin system VapC family toxin [Acetobacteraceae bacterium]